MPPTDWEKKNSMLWPVERLECWNARRILLGGEVVVCTEVVVYEAVAVYTEVAVHAEVAMHV